MRVVLASGNPGKLRELAALLSPLGLDLVSQISLGVDAAPETGRTFVENALLKARHAAAMTGLPALADDSGIEVDALGGRPGVFSARYAGERATDQQNLQKLLQELRDVRPPERTARYRCAIAYVEGPADNHPVLADGTWEGTLIDAPRGLGGFGYDPIFVPAGFVRTAAQLGPEEKNRLSHRGKALRALAEKLAERRPSSASRQRP